MMKRLLMPMLIMGIILAMTSMAFGQASTVTCGLSAPLGSTTRGTATGHTEPVAAGAPTAAITVGGPAGGGDIRVTCQNTGATINPGVVVLTVSLGVPITDTTAFPAGAVVRVAGGSGDLAAGTNVGISSVNAATGQVVIGLGTPVTTGSSNPTAGVSFTGNTTSAFDLLGVLVSLNGKSGVVTASLSASGGVNVGTPPSTPTSNPTVQVIDSITAGLLDPTVPTGALPTVVTSLSGGAAVLNSAGVAVGGKNNFTIRIQEAAADVFRAASQFNGGTSGTFPPGTSSSVQVLVQLNNIPAGLNISGCSAVLTNTASPAVNSGGGPTVSQGNFSSASPTLTVTFASAVDLSNVDVLWITCSTVGVGTATLPLPSTSVTAQVTLAPNGTALCSTGNVPSATGTLACTSLITGNIPRYQLLLQPTTPLAVILFPPSQTTLLLPLASVGPGYNTGIAIANTTADPFGTGGGGASPLDGTVTFVLYKNDGTSKTYTTTTGSPGSGLTGAGVVKSGSTYLVNLSEILSAASFGTTFNGYVFITANFTNAHGAATIYVTTDGSAALSSPVLVVTGGAGQGVSAAAPRNTPESLGQ